MPDRDEPWPKPRRYCSCGHLMVTWEEPNLLGGDVVRRATCESCGKSERW